ncbi:hypothetical protein LOTGIDRAFT_157669 [Lottia gigantea]|uniref:Uncharacterized protein n=1 Tax=Lottia gigantea TaxID=225164 RepID=V4AZC5_LOTGI|nr:hypothetical protein LOTGIDRAFT_157669 [Lottia gigantea]ESP00461.1 hypothetical protein LOTGIDRAFT_157669 [Lottia gigantea]
MLIEHIPDITPSLESRDNPFLPGSPLAKETEDLLKRATIIRDKFYLDKDGNRVETPTSPNGIKGKGDIADNAKVVVEDVVSSVQQEVQAASPSPNSPSKENGKVNDLVTPESVKVEINDKDQQAPAGGNHTDKPTSPKNKKKEKKKCCSIQ